MAGKRSKAAMKTAGVKVRITAKQKAARKLNIAVARSARRKGKRLRGSPKTSAFERATRRKMQTLFKGGQLMTGGQSNSSTWEAVRRVSATKARVRDIKLGKKIKW